MRVKADSSMLAPRLNSACSRRISDCQALLEQRLLPRLISLAAWQALSQTSRA